MLPWELDDLWWLHGVSQLSLEIPKLVQLMLWPPNCKEITELWLEIGANTSWSSPRKRKLKQPDYSFRQNWESFLMGLKSQPEWRFFNQPYWKYTGKSPLGIKHGNENRPIYFNAFPMKCPYFWWWFPSPATNHGGKVTLCQGPTEVIQVAALWHHPNPQWPQGSEPRHISLVEPETANSR